MNETSEKKSKLKSFCKSIGGVTVRKDYDIGIKIFTDGETETPKMNTSIKGTIKFGLAKALVLVAALSLVCCVISSVCRLFRR